MARQIIIKLIEVLSSAKSLTRFFRALALTCANRIEQFEAETNLTQYIMQTKTPRLPVCNVN